MGTYYLSPERREPGAAECVDLTSTPESCLRVDGGEHGAVVQNDGPGPVDTALAVEVDSEEHYTKITTVADGKQQKIAKHTQRDFWAVGTSRARLVVTRK